jgi:hypothetical protein
MEEVEYDNICNICHKKFTDEEANQSYTLECIHKYHPII